MRNIPTKLATLFIFSLLAMACTEEFAFIDEFSRVEMEDTPCTETSLDGIHNVCVWAAPSDLDNIQQNATKRIEIPGEVTLAGVRYLAGEFEVHGGAAREYPKKSYRIKFAKGHAWYDFFGEGIQKHRRLVLQAGWIDSSYMRNKLAFDLTRAASGLAPRVSFARLYLNGELEGLYQVIERVDDEFLEKNGLSEDGYLYKAESHYADWASRKDQLNGFARKNDTPKTGSDLVQLMSVLHQTEPSFSQFEEAVSPLLNLGDVNVWHAIMTFAQNLDTFTKNYYLYHDSKAEPGTEEDQFRLIQWDADATFGVDWDATRYEHVEHNTTTGTLNRNAFSPIYFGIAEYRQQYLEMFENLLNTELSVGSLHKRIDEIASLISSEAQADLERWKMGPSFREEVAYIKGVVETRHRVLSESISDELQALSL